MTNTQFQTEINNALDKAEAIWKKVEPKLKMMNEGGQLKDGFGRSLPSNIPGHPMVNPIKPEVDNFIAFVLDIRNSSEHLTQHYAAGKASQLERVLYEVTAVNTVGSIITNEKNGKITEFLGDGFLALYKVSDNDKGNIYKAHHAAKDCISIVGEVVNPILAERYNLPGLKIGIGLAYSKAIITVVGHGDNLHPKAMGECVFRATKLSDGFNEICVDDRLEAIWPISQGGKLQFKSRGRSRGFSEYIIEHAKS